MSKIYLFDVDGTLTHAKQKIDPTFAKDFKAWMVGKEVYIVSGGSFVRIINQLGLDITERCSGIFACMGNVFYQKIDSINETGYSEWETVYENRFVPPKGLYRDLDSLVKTSEYHTKTGLHYEERVGMINFSVVGRNATIEQRHEYSEYDQVEKEREEIVSLLKSRYATLDFAIGGAVSIDIFNTGNDKSQIIDKYFNEAVEHNEIVFYGDRIAYPGNDYPLAHALSQFSNARSIEVNCWEDTRDSLLASQFA